MKKPLLVLSSILLLGLLASCGQPENHNPGAVTDDTSSTPASTTEDTSDTSAESTGGEQSTDTGSLPDPVTYPALTIAVYQKFVGETDYNATKTGFETYLRNHNITITNLVWDYGITGNLKALNDHVKEYNTEHSTAKIDVILGAKAWNSDCDDYLKPNYSVLKDGDNIVEMTYTNDAGTESTDRRIWLLNDTPNLEVIKVLLKELVN